MPETQPDGTDPVAAVDALLDRLVSVLSGTGGGGGAPTTGTAADDGIVVTVGPDGRVHEIEIDPRLLRRSDSIGAGIAAAVNEAVKAAPQRDRSTSTVDDLKQIQEDSLVVTQQMNASLLTALERLKRS